MPYSVQVFCRREQYEPSVTFYCSTAGATTDLGDTVEAIATGLQYVMVDSAECTRFEAYNAAGVKINEGPLAGFTGTWASNVADPHLFMLVRKNVSGEAEKPSVMYTPFVGSTAVINGIMVPAMETAFALATASWLGVTLWNSDGLPINSYTFRHLTRRKKVRRLL